MLNDQIISFSISQEDFYKLKLKAKELGITYKKLIKELVHQYVNDMIVVKL